MDKIVLNLDDLMVDTFTTAASLAELSDEWTGCMSDCGGEVCG
jgi:hypothetical protein